jgi:hypothetical protein
MLPQIYAVRMVFATEMVARREADRVFMFSDEVLVVEDFRKYRVRNIMAQGYVVRIQSNSTQST